MHHESKKKQQEDEGMQQLAKRNAKGNVRITSETRTKSLYLHVKQELSMAEGLIFREQHYSTASRIQRKVIKQGHSLGHLGKTKTKHLSREK